MKMGAERRLGLTFNLRLTGPELLRLQCFDPERELTRINCQRCVPSQTLQEYDRRGGDLSVLLYAGRPVGSARHKALPQEV